MSSQSASRASCAPDGPSLIDPEVDEVIPLMNAPSHPLFCQRGRNGQPVGRNALERWRTVGARAADGAVVKLPTILLAHPLLVDQPMNSPVNSPTNTPVAKSAQSRRRSPTRSLRT